MSNNTSKLPVIFDEGSQFISGALIRARDNINASLAKKNHIPILKLDFSKLPFCIYTALIEHPALKSIMLHTNRSDIDFICLTPNDKALYNSDWTFIASLDTWGVSTIPIDVLNDWYIFRNWMLQFDSLGRTKIFERIKDHRFLSWHTQAHSEYAPNKLHNHLKNNEDKKLLSALLNTNKEKK